MSGKRRAIAYGKLQPNTYYIRRHWVRLNPDNWYDPTKLVSELTLVTKFKKNKIKYGWRRSRIELEIDVKSVSLLNGSVRGNNLDDNYYGTYYPITLEALLKFTSKCKLSAAKSKNKEAKRMIKEAFEQLAT